MIPQKEGPSGFELHRLKMMFSVGPDYTLVREIGKGSYGIVVLAIHNLTGKQVAIKKLEDIFLYVQDAKRLT